MRPVFILWLVLWLAATILSAEDWPEWRGRGRTGEWRESGIVEKFPDHGLPVRWTSTAPFVKKFFLITNENLPS